MVSAACFQRRTIEGLDLRATLGYECQMKMGWFLLGLKQTQGGHALGLAQLNAVGWPLSDNSDSEWLKRLKEERLALRKVADAELDVVKHELPLSKAATSATADSEA